RTPAHPSGPTTATLNITSGSSSPCSNRRKPGPDGEREHSKEAGRAGRRAAREASNKISSKTREAGSYRKPSITALCSAGRICCIALFSRVGFTRLVRNTTYTSACGSIHNDVPVKPVWPNEVLDIFAPHDEVGSIVSHPSAR